MLRRALLRLLYLLGVHQNNRQLPQHLQERLDRTDPFPNDPWKGRWSNNQRTSKGDSSGKGKQQQQLQQKGNTQGKLKHNEKGKHPHLNFNFDVQQGNKWPTFQPSPHPPIPPQHLQPHQTTPQEQPPQQQQQFTFTAPLRGQQTTAFPDSAQTQSSEQFQQSTQFTTHQQATIPQQQPRTNNQWQAPQHSYAEVVQRILRPNSEQQNLMQTTVTGDQQLHTEWTSSGWNWNDADWQGNSGGNNGTSSAAGTDIYTAPWSWNAPIGAPPRWW